VNVRLPDLHPLDAFGKSLFTSKGSRIAFWPVTSGSLDPMVVQGFLGDGDCHSTLMNLMCNPQIFSAIPDETECIPDETECILLPGAEFEVKSWVEVNQMRSNVTLEEVDDSFGKNLL
jgi:hypothetical protein